MKISVGFSKHPGSILSSLIRWVQGTDYSHVYIRRNSRYGEYVYQASGLQVNFMNIDVFLEHNVISEEYEFDIPESMHDELMKFCIKYAGRPYAKKELFLIAWRLLSERLGIATPLHGDGDRTFVCSALGALFCTVILGIKIEQDEDLISPKELNPYVAKYGKRTI